MVVRSTIRRVTRGVSSGGGSSSYVFTSNGTDYIDLATQYIPGSGDWQVDLDVFIPSGTPTTYDGFLGQADAVWASAFLVYFQAGWKVSYGNFSTHSIGFTPVTNAWNAFRLRKVATTMFVSVDGGASEVSGTCASTINITNATRLASNRFQNFACRVSNFRVQAGGVTTTFPLNDGPGAGGTNRDIRWSNSSGGGGVVTGAVVGGTVANQWANRR